MAPRDTVLKLKRSSSDSSLSSWLLGNMSNSRANTNRSIAEARGQDGPGPENFKEIYRWIHQDYQDPPVFEYTKQRLGERHRCLVSKSSEIIRLYPLSLVHSREIAIFMPKLGLNKMEIHSLRPISPWSGPASHPVSIYHRRTYTEVTTVVVPD